MTPRQTVFVTAVGLAIFILVVELIRRHKMREKYALAWFFTAVFLLSVPWLYPVYVSLGRLVGIQDPTSIFYFVAIIGLVLFCLQFTLSITTAYNHRKAHTQQLALLENRIRELEKRLAAAGSDQTGPDQAPAAEEAPAE